MSATPPLPLASCLPALPVPQLTGYIQVPGEDEYEFTLGSADGSRLYINGQLVIDHGEPF